MEKLGHTKSQKDLSSSSDEFEEDDDQLNSEHHYPDTDESIEEDDTRILRYFFGILFYMGITKANS